MFKVKRSWKSFLDGWEFIEFILDELDQKMREGKLVEDDYFDGFYSIWSSGCNYIE